MLLSQAFGRNVGNITGNWPLSQRGKVKRGSELCGREGLCGFAAGLQDRSLLSPARQGRWKTPPSKGPRRPLGLLDTVTRRDHSSQPASTGAAQAPCPGSLPRRPGPRPPGRALPGCPSSLLRGQRPLRVCSCGCQGLPPVSQPSVGSASYSVGHPECRCSEPGLCQRRSSVDVSPAGLEHGRKQPMVHRLFHCFHILENIV